MIQSQIGRLLAETKAMSTCCPEEPKTPSIAPSLTYSESADEVDEMDAPHQDPPRRRRASTRLIAQSSADIQRITGESTQQLIKRCCGGGCCMKLEGKKEGISYERIPFPDNDAYRSLQLKIEEIPTVLNNVAELPTQTTFLLPIRKPSNGLPSPADSIASLKPETEVTEAIAEASESQPTSATEDSESKSPTPTTLKETSEPESKPADAIVEASEKLQTATLEDTASKLAPTVTTAEDFLQTPTPAYTLEDLDTTIQPPSFVQPHPPFHVFPAPIRNTRELTKPGAEKRTFHFDLDITDYPAEEGTDFIVGGAIGISAPNDSAIVEEILDLLLIPRFLRDKPVLLKTTGGRFPTVWGDEKARELVTTRRDLLTWCTDIQSYPPVKGLIRILAEHATDANEKKILLFLCSAEGQGVFCDFRTGPHLSLSQILHAFPSARPPMDQLISVLQPLMPRFYSLSNDPHESYNTIDGKQHRLIEIAVTVHETDDWRAGSRTGIGSGFFQRQALAFEAARAAGQEAPKLYAPMFKGLMANPLAAQFMSDGPMLLIGAGVGIAPFRGFVQRRLKTANCANKVWVLQGIRDSLVDEIYGGEWGVAESDIKRIVESRRGEGRYVQEEVRAQSDLVWYIVNSVDGRVFVCGSTKGMGEGVEEALIDVAMQKGNLQREEARKFWELKKEVGQYIAETW